MARSPTVLLAENAPKDALVIRLAFEQNCPGIRVSVVSNGLEAVKYLKGQQPYAERQVFPFPSLVLINLTIPEVSGFEVLRWIRQQPHLNGLPVVMLANSGRDHDSKLAYELGANSYVIKRNSAEQFAKAMVQVAERWLGQRKWFKAQQESETDDQREAA